MADGTPLAPLSSRVRDLERIARRLDPGTEQLESMWSAVGGKVLHAASHRGDQPAYAAAAPDVIPPLTIDEEPTGIDEALSALEAVNATGINQASGGHFAFIPGGGVFPAALGDLVADVGNAYAGVSFAAPAAAALERSLVRWMADLLGYPDSAGGDLTSGASVAHLEAIVTAREAADLASADAATAVVYLTTETHHCIEKALHVAGLASCVVRHVDVDARRRMRPERLDAIVRDDRRRSAAMARGRDGRDDRCRCGRPTRRHRRNRR
jgi:aromatic-L-amino-acid/L-tryptophan decarboxylase